VISCLYGIKKKPEVINASDRYEIYVTSLTHRNLFEIKTVQTKKGKSMKKVFSILISLALFTSVAIAPVYAGGDKNHGEVGTGEVDQGDTGSDTGNASGDDAQDNQVP
jgi:hypothetical protein